MHSNQTSLRTRLSVLAALLSVAVVAQAQAGPQIDLKLTGEPKVGENPVTVTVAAGATVVLNVLMTNMDMGVTHPKLTDRKDGTYSGSVRFSMPGPWRVEVVATTPDGAKAKKAFDFHVHKQEGHDAMGNMASRFGPWSMQRDGSGTSWLPESSPMFMKHLPSSGRFELDAMGFVTFNYSDAGGPRGDSRAYSNSMAMLMARRETGGGILGLSFMASLDPVFNGEFGYPNLFQTGETAYGLKLTDYQHPHDLIAELAVSYSHPVAKGTNLFVYAAPVGEPALGGPTFMHRPSGMEIPEAPISHHWFDSTHISWGVVTLGMNSDKWQLEGSLFNGHEPDENRFSPDPLSLNSASGRVTFNPTKDLSFNTSYGYLNSPESTEPGVDQHRLTFAAVWSKPLAGGDNLSATAAFGRNMLHGENSDAFLAEATYLNRGTSWFARWEHVMKDELVGVPDGNHMVNKFLVGATRDVTKWEGLDVGVGAYAGFYSFPSVLKSHYGSNPLTLGVFLRIRPQRMQHGSD
ncbi:MAG: FixH family protein [Armatimonadetes bacterium]|nr:FixH family protein [Armatimonadota bacterium]